LVRVLVSFSSAVTNSLLEEVSSAVSNSSLPEEASTGTEELSKRLTRKFSKSCLALCIFVLFD
jgi:hypothetical protein